MIQYQLIVHHGIGQTQHIPAPAGSNLLDLLQAQNLTVAAPCGGHGTCGKCKVLLGDRRGDIEVLSQDKSATIISCQTEISSDLEVTLVEPNAVKIQSESYFPDLPIQFDKRSQNEYGIAVDIGTTTVVVYLEDMHSHHNIGVQSFINPQQSHGADVVTRIAHCATETGLQLLHELIVTAIEEAIVSLCSLHQKDPLRISEIAVAGNTSMLHIFAGVDPSSLAQYPFTPVFLEEQVYEAKELGFKKISHHQVRLLPSISAYVGADILAGLAASEIPDESVQALFLDIGTNGEMALGNQDGILSCATAAGPAFEGARISCGLGGVSGAIHSFSGKIFKTIGQVPPTGLCGSGLIDVIAWLLETQQLDPSGYAESPLFFTEGLSLSPQDIREVQLAKAAIAAGIQTLCSQKGIAEEEIQKVYLAGGFGHAINPETAAAIGLFPASFIPKIIRAGNTAGLGARLSLHASAFNQRIAAVKNISSYFELSNDMGFNEAFVMQMNF